MFRRAAFAPPGAHRWNIGLVPHFFCTVRPRRQFNERVQRHIHPGTLGLVVLHKVGIYAAKHSLVRHNQNVLATFQFHNDWLQANNNVTVRFSAGIPVVVLVFVAGNKVLGVTILDFLVC